MSRLQVCLTLCSVVIVTGGLLGAEERILYAAPSATGAQDGLSPSNPLELQTALSATMDAKESITILLADGHYRRAYIIPVRADADADKPLTLRAVYRGPGHHRRVPSNRLILCSKDVTIDHSAYNFIL